MVEEGEGSSEMEFTDLEITADFIDASVIFHVVIDILGFILHMHQQIPSILQDVSFEFDALNEEHKDLETILAQTEMKASQLRIHVGRKREVKRGIKRLKKLMNTIASVRTSLQLIISEIPNIERVLLVLGGSPVRPQHVYELCFSHGRVVASGACDFTKSKAAEWISRKAIRTLLSKGAGSASYPGPTKLFLLVKARSSFNLPLHFLPKRDFRYSKKIVPLGLRMRCRNQHKDIDAQHDDCQPANSVDLMHSTPTSNDWIWFQCRHVIKGLACQASSKLVPCGIVDCSLGEQPDERLLSNLKEPFFARTCDGCSFLHGNYEPSHLQAYLEAHISFDIRSGVTCDRGLGLSGIIKGMILYPKKRE